MGSRSSAAPTQTLLQYLIGARCTRGARRSSASCWAACSASRSRRSFVHSRLAERAFVPYVIASQTIPIIALAPLIVFALGQGVLSVVVIATYLTFFPVTIAMMRGLRSFDPRALELMRSYGASKTRDLPQAAAAGVDAVLLHRAQDRRHGQHRRRHHRRGHRRHLGGARARDHDLQPVLHHRAREAVGRDLRGRRARDRVLRRSSGVAEIIVLRGRPDAADGWPRRRRHAARRPAAGPATPSSGSAGWTRCSRRRDGGRRPPSRGSTSTSGRASSCR